MKLTIKLNVNNKIEAYDAITNLAFDYKVIEADLDGYKEKFNKKNTPFHFLKNNKKNKKVFRDIRAERGLK